MLRLIIFYFFVILIFPALADYKDEDETITRIEDAWNNIETLSASFRQLNSDGSIDNGIFYLYKPYKSRFEYENKKNELIITNKNLLNIVDADGYQIDGYLLGNTPLKMILGKNLNIRENFNINDIYTDGAAFIIDVSSFNKNEEERAIFFFSKKNYDLKKWEFIDKFDNKTVLEFTNLQKNISISKNLFVIRYN
tara:strand:+ start:18 stop:602 length:585 start_codon:yes stop_codon:yes gene_type:complete